MNWLLDTNAIIYIQKGLVQEPIPDIEVHFSIISRIELLSFLRISASERDILKSFLLNFNMIHLTKEVEDWTVRFRLQHKLKIPDAIICAST